MVPSAPSGTASQVFPGNPVGPVAPSVLGTSSVPEGPLLSIQQGLPLPPVFPSSPGKLMDLRLPITPLRGLWTCDVWMKHSRAGYWPSQLVFSCSNLPVLYFPFYLVGCIQSVSVISCILCLYFMSYFMFFVVILTYIYCHRFAVCWFIKPHPLSRVTWCNVAVFLLMCLHVCHIKCLHKIRFLHQNVTYKFKCKRNRY